MKKLLFISTILLFSTALWAQTYQLSANIDKDCNSVPDLLSVPSGKTAYLFTIISIEAGQNCYNEMPLELGGFLIKNAQGELIYEYKEGINKKENLQALLDFELDAGIYMIYVQGGQGAQLELNYQIK